MSFTTVTFVLFLSLVFPLYWALRVRALQNMLLLAASYAFYGWWDYRFCLLLLLTSVVDYGVALGMESTGSTRWRRCLLALSLAANLGTLGFFKYYNFFVDNLCIVCRQVDWHVDTRTLDVVLPGLPRWQRWAVYTSLFWITLYVGPRSTSPFTYFQF